MVSTLKVCINIFHFKLFDILLYLNFLNIFAVQALMDIKRSLNDPHGVLSKWEENYVDPCGWAMVGCSHDDFVISL